MIANLFILGLAIFLARASAQTLPFRKYTHGDGLLSDEVKSICQDSKGYLWVGTPEGISTFDGREFVNYTVREGLGTAQVNMVLESKHVPGVMYVALGGGGVCTFRNGVFSLRRLGESFSSNYVIHIVEDSLGRLWCTTEEGLYRIEGDQVTLLVPKVNDLFLESVDSALWSGTGHHLAVENPLEDSSSWDLSHIDGMPARGITCSYVDREGVLWIGTAWEGLWRLTSNNLVSFPLKSSKPGYYHYSPAAVDGQNHFWAISGDGLWEFWREGRYLWHKHLHANTSHEGHGWLNGVAIDPSGCLWLISTEGWVTIFHVEYVQGQHSRLEQQTAFTPLRPSENYVKTDPLAFAFDSSGHLFFGVHTGEILEYDVRHRPVFVGEIYEHKGIGPWAPFAIILDKSGNIWDGTFGGGVLAFLRNGERKMYTGRDGLPDLSIRALIQDKRGRIWAGTRRGGIAVLQAGRFVPVTLLDGLISNSVWSLCEDDGDRIWAATSLGLQAIDGNTLKPLPPQGHLTGTWSGKCGVTPRGQLWWYEEGVALKIFDYLAETKNTVAPPIFVTEVTANGEMQSLTPAVSYEKNNWTIRYVGVSMKDPDGVRYRYRIPELGTDWSAQTRERSITFAALSPGTYTFMVEAMNADGIPCERPAHYVFSILPPFWNTSWFRAVSVALVCVLLYALYRYRLRKLLEVERLRTAIATDLHDDIGTGLTRIALFADATLCEVTNAAAGSGAAPRENVGGWLREIGATSRSLVDGLNDIVWAVDPKNDSFDNLLMRMKTLAGRMLEARGIDYDIHIPSGLSDIRLSLPVRRQFFLVFKETMSNVIKHAQATRVELSMERSDGHLVMNLRDNGVGFVPSAAPRGNGLRNMRNRAAALGGTYDVSSEPGKGTSVCFVVRIP